MIPSVLLMQFADYVPLAARIMEGGGILVMVFGPLVALALSAHLKRQGGRVVCRSFRQELGRAILLGLEFLVAADIIRTVSEVPTLENEKVIVLAVIVLIRTFLSFALEVELEGRRPWKKASTIQSEAPK